MNERRGNLYLLTGLVIGLALGLLYGWVISPVQYMDTEPSSLAEAHKDQYRQVIALAYQANQNLGRARQRLALLDSENTISVLAAQAQRMVGEDGTPEEARALALLAADMGNGVENPGPEETVQSITETAPVEALPTEITPLPTVAEAVFTPTNVPPTTPTITATATQTPRPTLTSRPTRTAVPTLATSFVLTDQRSVCDNTIPPGQLQFLVTDAQEKPLPGVRIQVVWQDGESAFFTGLAPELSPGYADFTAAPGTSYSIKVGEASRTIEGLVVDSDCSWVLEFTQSGSD